MFRCALKKKSGLGHLNRCIQIAKSISCSFKTVFIIPNSSQTVSKILNNNGLTFKSVPKNLELSEEISFYPINIAGIILDLVDDFYRSQPELFNNYLKVLADNNYFTIVLEGMFEDRILTKDHPAVSLIIQPYVGAEKDTTILKTPILAGSKYVIIGPEYLKKHYLKYENESRRILITLGGSDPYEVTTWILAGLKSDMENSSKYAISVVVGPNFTLSHIKKINEFKYFFPKINIIFNPASLLSLYRSTDLVLLGSGATSRYEAALCGIPAIGVGIMRIHDRQCFLHSGYGGFEYLGFYGDIKPKYFCSRINKILGDNQNHEHLSDAALNFIDGLGAQRIARRIEIELSQ